MLKAMQTGFGLLVGTLIYSLLISGSGVYRLDWPRAIFLVIVGFLAHWLFITFIRRPSGSRPK